MEIPVCRTGPPRYTKHSFQSFHDEAESAGRGRSLESEVLGGTGRDRRATDAVHAHGEHLDRVGPEQVARGVDAVRSQVSDGAAAALGRGADVSGPDLVREGAAEEPRLADLPLLDQRYLRASVARFCASPDTSATSFALCA